METARDIGGTEGDESAPSPTINTLPVYEPKSTIYIGNLFFDVTENDLVKELSRFGTVTKCRLIRDSRGLSKG
jgi:RNA recognition motif-containing protein